MAGVPISNGSNRFDGRLCTESYLFVCRISVAEAEKSKHHDYDINGYRKDHRMKNVKVTSKFDGDFARDGELLSESNSNDFAYKTRFSMARHRLWGY